MGKNRNATILSKREMQKNKEEEFKILEGEKLLFYVQDNHFKSAYSSVLFRKYSNLSFDLGYVMKPTFNNWCGAIFTASELRVIADKLDELNKINKKG